MYLVRKRISSPESALFLRELYNKEYTDELDFDIENTIGAILARDSENVNNFNSFELLVDEYVRYDIYKFFGLTVLEYLDTNRIIRTTLTNKAVKLMEIQQAELASIKNRHSKQSDDFSKMFNL